MAGVVSHQHVSGRIRERKAKLETWHAICLALGEMLAPANPSDTPDANLWASASSSSWLSLVAAATLGLGLICHFRTEIVADTSAFGETPVRIIVQAYAPDALDGRGLPALGARPLASTQKVVTSRDLARGVSVDLIQLAATEDSVLIAWLESDDQYLDFDALNARPAHDAWFGLAALVGPTKIVLSSAA